MSLCIRFDTHVPYVFYVGNKTIKKCHVGSIYCGEYTTVSYSWSWFVASPGAPLIKRINLNPTMDKQLHAGWSHGITFTFPNVKGEPLKLGNGQVISFFISRNWNFCKSSRSEKIGYRTLFCQTDIALVRNEAPFVINSHTMCTGVTCHQSCYTDQPCSISKQWELDRNLGVYNGYRWRYQGMFKFKICLK